MKRRTLIALLSVLFLVLFLGSWKAYTLLARVPRFILPAPEDVAVYFVRRIFDGTLVYHTAITTATILAGFLIGSLLGFIGGYFISRSRAVEAAVFPYIMLIQATPKVSIIPLLVIWFGLGLTSKMMLIVLSAFFPVMLNTIAGFRSIPEEYYDLLNILKADARQRLFKVKIPLALPLLIAGLKVAMVQAVIGAIVSEWVSGQQGLGYLLVLGSTQYNSLLLIASILATTFMGVLLYQALNRLEARLLFWHESQLMVAESS